MYVGHIESESLNRIFQMYGHDAEKPCPSLYHVGSSDPTCVQNFRPVPLTVFEILGLKLKNKYNDKKNWRNRLFAISPVCVVQFSPKFRKPYILTLAIILCCQKWIITESESLKLNF